MKHSHPRILAAIVPLFFMFEPLMAAPPASKEGYQYPELLVVPKASQKLASEAKAETKNRFRAHYILQIPAIMTLTAGLGASGMQDAKSKEVGGIATGVGLGWLLTTVGLSMMYTPYATGQAEVNALADKNLEQNLLKERRAEEALALPAYMMRRIQYISAVTNFGASIAVTSLEEDNQKVKAIAGLAAAAAFLPLIFEHPWISTYDQQQDYKKKIYGPVAQLTMLSQPKTGHLTPGLELSLRF